MIMPRIRCLYEECVFLSKGFCLATSIELDPEDGCLTYSEESADFLDTSYMDEDDFVFEDDWEDEGFEELDLDEVDDF
jgi:hypothetical protein